jgi:SSS family transporter
MMPELVLSPLTVILLIAGYFGVLVLISWLTSRGGETDNHTFFTANRQSPWYLVAFGMIGASLSGVTFISVPGEVGNSFFSYFQVVLGYLLGYATIIWVLLPLYYRLNLVSIYEYLEQRFGFYSYKTGSVFFILSRVVGASFRLYLVANVLQIAIFETYGFPFWATVAVTILLIWLYTFRGGIKTIVFTDTLQTLFMLLAVGISIYLIGDEMGLGLSQLVDTVSESKLSKMFFFDDPYDGKYFWKQFISGAFITIVMTGLDQDMMQKNLTVKTLKDAQKNMFWFSIVLVGVNLLFLTLGVMLYQYADTMGIALPEKSDELYPILALHYFSPLVAAMFLLGIIAAAYSSADSALTALTTSFCVDILGLDKGGKIGSKQTRLYVHIGFSVLLLIVILIFNALNDKSVINQLFRAAGYTYGPLLGLFAFGQLTRLSIKDNLAPLVCVLSPIVSFIIDTNSKEWLGGFEFGFFILLLNGSLTFIGLLLISRFKSNRNLSVSAS